MPSKDALLLIIAVIVITGATRGWNDMLTATLEGLVILVVALGLYFLPTWLADRRNKRNLTAIFALNLLAGWTFIGWVVALVWALAEDR